MDNADLLMFVIGAAIFTVSYITGMVLTARWLTRRNR